MSYINNFNPRRMIWFNQHEPKNKMDLWLSYNRHYTEDEDTSEESQTSDNPNQRACDLILKAWDCGAWVPIVGFNTTSANKIDIVEGNTLYHPAIFTGENPNDLYDAGTLGELLNNSNFVNSTDWLNLFNNPNFYNSWNSSGNSHINLWRATPTRLGGICANTFSTVAANGFAECKFYDNSNNKLYVSGSDMVNAINGYISSGGTHFIDIDFATTEKCGGIYSDTHSSGVTSSKLVEVKFYPTGNVKAHRLSVDSDEIINGFISTFDDEYPLLLGGNGITLGLTLDHSQITWEVSNLRYASDGKYARSKITGTGDHTIEWISLSDDGITTTKIDAGTDVIISAAKKDTVILPDASGNVLISTAITTESTGNYKFKEHCVYKPSVIGASGSVIHHLTIANDGSTVENESYIRFKTSSVSKPMLYFNKDTKYIPSYSVSGYTAVYDSTGNTNYIQLEENTDYSIDIMFDWIKLEKITTV